MFTHSWVWGTGTLEQEEPEESSLHHDVLVLLGTLGPQRGGGGGWGGSGGKGGKGRKGWGGDRVVIRDGSGVEIEGRIGEDVCQENKGSGTVSGSE